MTTTRQKVTFDELREMILDEWVDRMTKEDLVEFYTEHTREFLKGEAENDLLDRADDLDMEIEIINEPEYPETQLALFGR